MPRPCSICTHPDRPALEAAIVSGEPFRRIATRFATSEAAVRRHARAHIPAHLAQAQQATEVAQATDLLGHVRQLQARALAILSTAEQAGDHRAALGAIREARSCIELLGRLAGQLQDGTTVNVIASPEWSRIRSVLTAALAPFPDAGAAVAAALLPSTQ